MVDVDKSRVERSTHQSLGRGLRVLEAVAALNGAASLADVARRTDLARSTTHYLMQALVTHGYLRQAPGARSYQLGLKVFRLAGHSLSSEQIAKTAMPALNELSRLTHESVAVGIFQNDAVTLVATRDTEGPVRVVQSVGARRPVHCTALGKVLLAWLPDTERSQIVAGIKFQKYAPKTIVQKAAFERELRRVRSSGYAIDDEEFVPGVRCLAAPVFDGNGEVTMAISAIGPKQRMTHQRLKECRPLVLDCASKLGVTLQPE